MRLTLLALVTSGLIACTGEQGPPGQNGSNGGTGDPGDPGKDALTRTSAEPAGANCPDGGVKIEVGVDANDNGILDDSEVNAASTQYVCNGNGKNSLVRTGEELAGANCPYGGTKIETGLDANNDGQLQDTEVNATATTYVCNSAPGGASTATEGINIAIKSVSNTSPVTVRFTMKDDRGFPLDASGAANGYSVNTAIQPRFSLSWFTKDPTTGFVSPLTVYTKSTSTSAPQGLPTAYSPASGATNGTMVENGWGAGDYTYTFPTTNTTNGPQAVAYDATKMDETHVLWIQASRQTDLVFTLNANTFYSANQPYWFIPSGNGTPMTREIAAQSGCDSCHAKFKAETLSSSAFHGGGRVNVGMCNVCHNPARTTNPSANSATFVHRIHNGENVATANLFHGIAATYPKDIRDCNTCHGAASQGAQAYANPSVEACGGCHDYVSFTGGAQNFCGIVGQLAYGSDGKPLACNHVGGPVDDTQCATCHGPTKSFPVAKFHGTVASPDPANSWLAGGTNANTNASYVAAVGYVPTGANAITYEVKSVDTWTDTSVTPNVKRPSITFRLLNNGTAFDFQTYTPGSVTELMPNMVGSPSVYFAWAVPQDGNNTPSDFNASASAYIKNVWNGSATTGTGAGTLSAPDASHYYTLKLTGVQIASNATMLTGGVGYTYSLSSTPPLVQTNLGLYPWTPSGNNDGKAQGGLSVPAPNVWKVATGYTARRQIVDNAKCNACHGRLGVEPTFHAGQRNDGPTCSFCHNPNRTSSGWSASSKYFIHGIHAGRKRVVPYTWHAASAGPGYDEVEFPGTLNACTTCHVPNTYDFTNTANLDGIGRAELTAVATGKYSTDPLTNSSYYTVSPYVVADGVTDYGAGFSYNAGTNATTQGSGNNLVITPITAACSSCHDTSIAIDHMQANGGYFYAPRATVTAANAPKEQCLICHGPGRVAAIGEVHQH
ncbi:MAG TPA: OmcA/MtrC family decaheme c-type cytochrome [Kofleriaceae bacterium]|nr:OmcA/MtrC family decaheme c-type cytochrome [Kofleriaceae bacterium]